MSMLPILNYIFLDYTGFTGRVGTLCLSSMMVLTDIINKK